MPVHGLAPQNLSPDKRVDVCADGDEDRGSTPLASSLSKFPNPQRWLAGHNYETSLSIIETFVGAS